MIYEKEALEGCYSVCNRTSITYLHATPDYYKSQFYPIEEKKRVMLAVAVILLIKDLVISRLDLSRIKKQLQQSVGAVKLNSLMRIGRESGRRWKQ